MGRIVLIDLGLFAIIHYIGSKLLSYRFYDRKKRLILFAVFYFISCLFNSSGNITHLSRLLMIFTYLCYLCVQFIPRKITLFVIIFFVSLIYYLAELLTTLVLYTLYPNFEVRKIHFFVLVIFLLIYALFSFAFVKIMKMYRRTLPKYSFGILILPTITILLILKINSYYELVNKSKALLFILLGLIIANFLTLYFFFKSLESVELKSKLKEEHLIKENLQMKYNVLNDTYLAYFNFLHDLLHRGMLLYKLVQNNDNEALKKEISELNEITFRKFNAIYSNNLALNIVINENISKVHDFKLEIRTEIYEDLSFISFDTQLLMFQYLFNNIFSYFDLQILPSYFLFFKTYARGDSTILKVTFSSSKDILVDYAEINEILRDFDVVINHRYNSEELTFQYLFVFNNILWQ